MQHDANEESELNEEDYYVFREGGVEGVNVIKVAKLKEMFEPKKDNAELSDVREMEEEEDGHLKVNFQDDYLSNSGRRRASHEGSLLQSISYVDTNGDYYYHGICNFFNDTEFKFKYKVRNFEIPAPYLNLNKRCTKSYLLVLNARLEQEFYSVIEMFPKFSQCLCKLESVLKLELIIYESS